LRFLEKIKKKSNFIAKIIIKILEYIFTFCAILSLLYVIALKLDFPQHAANNFLKKHLETADWTTEISEIFGIFPFSFNVMNINIQTKGGIKIDLKNIKFLFNWKSLHFNLICKEAIINKNTKNSSNNNFLKNIANNTLNINAKQILDFLKKYSNVAIFNLIKVESLHTDDSITGNIRLNLTKKKNKQLLEAKINNMGKIFTLQISDLKQNKTLKDPNISAYFLLEYNDEKSEGKISTQGVFSIFQNNISINTQIFDNKTDFLHRSNLLCNLKISELSNFLLSFVEPSVQSNRSEFATLSLKANILQDEFIVKSVVFSNKEAIINVYKSVLSTEEKKEVKICEAKLNFSNNFLEFFMDFAENDQQETHFTCDGVFSTQNKLININHFSGTIYNNQFNLKKELQIDLSNKTSSSILIDVNKHTLNIPKVYLDNKEKTTFTLSPLCLYFQDGADIFYFGTYQISGDINFEGLFPNAKIAIKSKFDQKDMISFKKEEFLVQKVDFLVNGEVHLNKDSACFKNGQLLSKDSVVKIELKMTPASKNVFSIIPAIKDMLSEAPLQNAVKYGDLVKLEGSIKGMLSLSPIAAFFVNGDVIKGNINTNLNISGFIRNPEISGKMILSNGYYENISNSVVLKNIEIEAVGEKNELHMRSIRFTDGTKIGTSCIAQNPRYNINSPPKGTAGGTGKILFFSKEYTLDPKLIMDLNCNFFQATYGEVVKARGTGLLKLSGPLAGLSENPIITGNVIVNPMVINTAAASILPSIDYDIKLNQKKRKKSKKDNKNEFLEQEPRINPNRFRLNITLNTGNNVIVKGDNELKGFVKGTVIAQGPLRSPYLVGELNVDTKKTNSYNLFGHILKVQCGTIKYSINNINESYIDIIMHTKINQTEASQTDVFVDISGYPSNLNISFRSNPPKSKEAILSLLLLKDEKNTANDLTLKGKKQIRAFSSQMLQDTPLKILDKIRGGVGLDSFEIVGEQDFSSGETVQSLRIGKQMKKVRVSFEQSISSKTNSKMTVRYDITPKISIEADVNTDKNLSDIGLQWTNRY
jgi:hypothetical protein